MNFHESTPHSSGIFKMNYHKRYIISPKLLQEKKKSASGMKGKHLCRMEIALLSVRRKGKRGIQGFYPTIEPDFNQINTFLLCQVHPSSPDKQ